MREGPSDHSKPQSPTRKEKEKESNEALVVKVLNAEGRSVLVMQISDIRELQYEKMGIGSSYLFRLDDGYVVSDFMNKLCRMIKAGIVYCFF